MNFKTFLIFSLLQIIGLFSEHKAFSVPIVFLGITEPGGTLARRHQQFFFDASQFSFDRMAPTSRKKCSNVEDKKLYLFDSGLRTSVEDLVFKAHNARARVGIGFLYSPEGLPAALGSEKLGFPVISPGATLDILFKKKYFKSLGFSISEQARLLSEAIVSIEKKPSVDIIVPVDMVFSLSLSKSLQKYLGIAGIKYNLIEYVSTNPEYQSLVQSKISQSNSNTLILTGYWNKSFQILNGLPRKNLTIFGNSEWAYNEDALENGLNSKIEVYFIADFTPASITGKFDFREMPSLARVRKNLKDFSHTFKSKFGYKPTALVTSLVDATNIACEVVIKSEIPSGDHFIKQFESMGVFWGLKGFYNIKKGIITRSAFLTKWDGSEFIGLKEYKAEMK